MAGSQEYRDRLKTATDSMLGLIRRQRSRGREEGVSKQEGTENRNNQAISPIERRKLGPYGGKHLFTESE